MATVLSAMNSDVF